MFPLLHLALLLVCFTRAQCFTRTSKNLWPVLMMDQLTSPYEPIITLDPLIRPYWTSFKFPVITARKDNAVFHRCLPTEWWRAGAKVGSTSSCKAAPALKRVPEDFMEAKPRCFHSNETASDCSGSVWVPSQMFSALRVWSTTFWSSSWLPNPAPQNDKARAWPGGFPSILGLNFFEFQDQ